MRFDLHSLLTILLKNVIFELNALKQFISKFLNISILNFNILEVHYG